MKGKLAFGYQTGKIGSLVGFKGAGGEQLWREYVSSPANPKTEAQAIQRFRWLALCAAWTSLKKIPVLAFDDKPGNQSTFNQFIVANHGMNVTVPEDVAKSAQQGTKGWLFPFMVTRGSLGTLCNVTGYSDEEEYPITQNGTAIDVNADNTDVGDLKLFSYALPSGVTSDPSTVGDLATILIGTSKVIAGDMITFVGMYNGVLDYWQVKMDTADTTKLDNVASKLDSSHLLTDYFVFMVDSAEGVVDAYFKNKLPDLLIPVLYPACATIIISRASSGSSFDVSTERLAMIYDKVSSFVGEDAAAANIADYVQTSSAILDPATNS